MRNTTRRGAADPPGERLSILIVDDHPALRAGLRSLIATEPGIVVQDDVESGESAYVSYRAHRPDIVIMDLAMDGYGGIEAIRRIREFDPAARIVVYTVHSSETLLVRALDAGVRGYVTKGNETSILMQAIREVAKNKVFVSPDMVEALVNARRPDRVNPLDRLTPKEFEIFRLVSRGHPVPECARILNLSAKTIRNHCTLIKRKLGTQSSAEMARLAIRAGLVEP